MRRYVASKVDPRSGDCIPSFMAQRLEFAEFKFLFRAWNVQAARVKSGPSLIRA